VLAEARGEDWRRLFRSVEEPPGAAAAIAQVHRALTADGRSVALKIQRPGIDRVIGADLAILKDLAGLLERYLPGTRMYRPVELVEHFAKVITLELDFGYEGRTMDLVRRGFQSEPGIAVPEVLWPLCSDKLRVREFAEGVRLSEPEGCAAAGVDTRKIAQIGVRYILKQVFEHGVYNADPHPANFVVRPDGVLVPLDFGMVGSLDGELKAALVDMLLAFVDKEPEKLMRVFFRLDLREETAERTALSSELGRLVNYYHHMPVAQLSIGRLLLELSSIIRRCRITLPVDLALTLKVMVTVESVGKSLDPDFDFTAAARPFVQRVRISHIAEWARKDRLLDLLEDSLRLGRSLPYDTYEVLKKLRSGRLRLNMDIEGLDRAVREIDRSANRLSFAVVIAGLLVGSSFVTRAGIGPELFGFPLLGLAGFLLAGFLGIWFLVGILRSGRL